MFERVILGLGGNVPSKFGTPAETIRSAIRAIGRTGLEIMATSRFFHTPCFPAGAGPDFVNAALLCRSRLGPTEILSILRQIESDHGRQRHSRWSSRTLDIDLLAVDDLVLPDMKTFELWRNLSLPDQKIKVPGQLILPHPRLQDRAFVLVPMADIAPDWHHPVLGLRVVEMLAGLAQSEKAAVCPMEVD